jgi:transposase
MPASGSTVLRLMHAAPLPQTELAPVIGVDDWAWRRGRSWGTIVVDLERHQVVDLLPDRSSATFEAWLRTRTGLAIMARDRSTGTVVPPRPSRRMPCRSRIAGTSC